MKHGAELPRIRMEPAAPARRHDEPIYPITELRLTMYTTDIHPQRKADRTHLRRTLAPLATALAFAFPGLAGCTPQQDHAETKPAARKKPVMLALAGYNYTNRYIGSFSVDGQGGGGVFVSTPKSGGGGSTCCVLYVPGNYVRKVTVRWEADACYYHVKSTVSNEVYDDLHPIFKEREVVVDDDIPENPQNFEVHFYPDGSIRAAITSGLSLPRLQLPAEREDKSRYPRCPNDRKPND